MKTIRSVQLIWATALVAISVGLSVNAPEPNRLAFLGVACVYLLACIAAVQSSRVAWIISILVPIVICALWLPMVVVSLIAYAKGDPRYRDSPATILVVAVEAVVFAAPALLLVILFWRQRAALTALVGAPHTGAA